MSGGGHVDVLVVGAGISGVCAGYYLKRDCPDLSFTILEARDAMGGTWDLFRYPGIRSDSDLYTFGFSFRPWVEDRAIASGESILRYIKDTAHEFQIDRHIEYGRRVVRANWNSAAALWEIDVAAEGEQTRYTCRFLYFCSGYYGYDRAHRPDWPGMDQFDGPIVHPQFWPPALDYRDKRVVVIGSGATAVTLVPSMAETAAKVTMLQRSPSYLFAAPAKDGFATMLRKVLPTRPAFAMARWKNVLVGQAAYQLARKRPNLIRWLIGRNTRRWLGKDYDLKPHFTPSYAPWDQRLCLLPDADLYRAMTAGRAEIVTDTIERFTSDGIKLDSGRELQADIVVTATGFDMQLFGGAALSLDGEPIDTARRILYKGMMLDGVPNAAAATGYTNASWTLKCELTSLYVCRLMNEMRASGTDWCVPVREDPALREEPVIDFTSGYVQRALPSLPKQGSRKPWKLKQNYLVDLMALKFGKLNDGVLRFGKRQEPRDESASGRPAHPVRPATR